ncbi:MAG: YfiR family protein [Candidatus Eisenbacteria bacterium]
MSVPAPGKLAAIVLTLITSLMALPVRAGEALDEHALKAAFLYNFAKFITWPDSAWTGSEAPFRIGIVGNDPFGQAFADALSKRSLHRRSIALVHVSTVTEIDQCQMVYFHEAPLPWFAMLYRRSDLVRSSRSETIEA